MASHLDLGAQGEELAARWLVRQGWKIMGRNVRVGKDELDIVAKDGSELVFVEVRSRSVGVMMPPELSVGPRKLRKLLRASKSVVRSMRYDGNWRIDIAAVTVAKDGTVCVELFSDITMGMEADRL